MINNDTITQEVMRDYSETFTKLKEHDMEKKADINFKAKEIDKALRLAWESLESHIQYTHGGKLVRNEDREFHKQCVRDYADIIKVLSELY